MRTTLAVALALGVLAPAPSAQRGGDGHGTLPAGWKVRFDAAAASPDQVVVEQKRNALTFTTGPAAVYYKPDMKASGDYELSAVVSQIKTTERPEAYGLIIAGAGLDKDTPRYTCFLVRQDGKYSIAVRNGAGTKTLVDWTAAAPMREPNGVKTSNTLLIRAVGRDVLFFIGGKQVHTLTRLETGGDGIAGIRIGKDLQVQVTKLALRTM